MPGLKLNHDSKINKIANIVTASKSMTEGLSEMKHIVIGE